MKMKENRMPEGLDENPNRLEQKDLEARWVQKNGVNHYGYKNNTCIDVEHGFIRRYAVRSTNIHDGQMLQMLLDPENTGDYVWAVSAFAGECFRDLMNLGRFESCIHEKGSRIKTAIRACVEHVFDCLTMSMGAKMTRRVGFRKTKHGGVSGTRHSTYCDIF